MTWLRDTLNNKGARAKCLKWAYFALATSLHILAKVTIYVSNSNLKQFSDDAFFTSQGNIFQKDFTLSSIKFLLTESILEFKLLLDLDIILNN